MDVFGRPVLLTACTLLLGALLSSGEWGSDKPVVYTVYNVAKTWNEAKSICTAKNSSMLHITNDTIWKLWINMLDTTIGLPNRVSQYWFGLHSPNQADLSQVFYEDCNVPVWTEYTQYRPSYIGIIQDQCWSLDIMKLVFGGRENMWISQSCSNTYQFICTWENDCVHSCDEFIIITPDCSLACSTLQTNGEIVDITTCKYRPIGSSASGTFCHVYKDTTVSGELFSICYKPSLLPPLPACSYSQTNPDLSTFTDSSVAPNSVCLSTTTAVPPASDQTCQCPCSLVKPANDTKQLTIEEKIEILKQELTIDKEQTSKNKRKLISATDERPSARNLGAFGLAVLVLVPVCIVLIDLSSLFQHFKLFSKSPLKNKRNPIQENVPNKKSFTEIGTHKESSHAIKHDNQLSKIQGLKGDDAFQNHLLQSSVKTDKPISVMHIRPKSSINPKIKVIHKDILDLKYQASMIASRIVANDVRNGVRPLEQDNVFIKGTDIAESANRKRERNENFPWLRML